MRAEDAFDVGAASAWLRTHAADPTGLDGEPDVRQFSGGASNLTYLLRYPSGRDLILRRAPGGTKARGAHDMRREHEIQAALAPVFPYVAPMVAFCDDPTVLGGDFYAMERIDGVIPRSTWPADVPLSPEQARQLCLNVVDVCAELHGVDADAAGLGHVGRGVGYVRRQVEGWSTRYRNALTPDNPDLVEVMAWLDAHQPDDVATCVIHNDFKIDNIVLAHDDPTRVVGVLDWEMATLGDPLMDVGGALAFWVQADDSDELKMTKRVPTDLPGMITREEFVQAYCDRMGFDMTPERWRFYEVFGLFRNAVIAQQIYYRYFHGQTTNEMFALFGPGVQILDRRIAEVLS
ncbi:aminoglycoside phosphotransferase (APT) family kinase protein [Nocardioides cavernae]|uniref:Aminoglycoside phosphotransferase (APT) family kinase protein n=1 Tax=Nocardioides cavernae TaxID=1921566 RepID=A0A7Y9H490_9ACTN|nr:phosphotransferase family protein [Nocardioides cavernae]NYE37655.1 aminoglycoside phosphotransferase (APT) family kinase protein [Nocardioides cavernae]